MGEPGLVLFRFVLENEFPLLLLSLRCFFNINIIGFTKSHCIVTQ